MWWRSENIGSSVMVVNALAKASWEELANEPGIDRTRP